MVNRIEVGRSIIERGDDAFATKRALTDLLEPEQRRAFLAACAAIERRFTERCTATGDPCLESGCAVADETCLEPLLRSAAEYRQACGAEWLKLVLPNAS
ncbi:MAG: hypothetical protein ACRD2I_05205 [Vicinamibacterales bacterium]